MSLEVYNLVAFAAGVGENSTCEDILLGDASVVVAPDDADDDDDVLAAVDPTSSETCEGLNTSETLPCSVHVVCSESQPFVLRPQVNLLFSPSSLQAVIAMPAPGLSVNQGTPVSLQCSQYPIIIRSFVHLPVLQYPAHASLSQFLSVQLPLLKIPLRKHSPSSMHTASDPQHDVCPLLVVQGVSGERVPSGK